VTSWSKTLEKPIFGPWSAIWIWRRPSPKIYRNTAYLHHTHT
jgi:hypothetical protein